MKIIFLMAFVPFFVSATPEQEITQKIDTLESAIVHSIEQIKESQANMKEIELRLTEHVLALDEVKRYKSDIDCTQWRPE